MLLIRESISQYSIVKKKYITMLNIFVTVFTFAFWLVKQGFVAFGSRMCCDTSYLLTAPTRVAPAPPPLTKSQLLTKS